MTKEEQRKLILIDGIKNNCYEVAEKMLEDFKEEIRADAIEECKYKIVDSLEKQLGCKVCSSYEKKYHCSKCGMQKTINSTVDILEKLKDSK